MILNDDFSFYSVLLSEDEQECITMIIQNANAIRSIIIDTVLSEDQFLNKICFDNR